MLPRVITLLSLSIGCALFAGAQTPSLAQTLTAKPPHRPTIIMGRQHPGRVTGIADDGVVVDLRNGEKQVVQFGEIWRIWRAFVSDEPAGTSVIDFANNRLFVATPLPDLIGNVSKKVALTKLTAPNGEAIYMAAGKVTDIYGALPGLHNPSSKTVIGTRDGTQQVLETIDAAKQIIGEAHLSQ